MKKKLFFIAAVLTIYIANAQQISEVKLKTNQFGLKKAKKGPKKVFIKSFNIYYEVYKEAVDYKNGYNGTRGKKVGSATARAAVGLDGVQSQDIQEKTNRLYQEFVNDFTSNGYEIITAEEASKVEFFEGWKKVTGPSINEAEKLPGVLSCVPEGFTALYKDRSKVAAKLNKVFKGLNTPVLSKQLDDALVIDVNVYILFSEIASKGFNLGSLDKVAKVKIIRAPISWGPYYWLELNVVVQLKFIRSWTQTDWINLFTALVVNPSLNEILSKDSTGS